MRTIRPIDESEHEAYLKIARDAFAGFELPPFEKHLARTRRHLAAGPQVQLAAVFDDEEMVGTLRLHAFRMNVFGAQLPLWGIGGVATSPTHRGRHVARDLMRWYLDHALAQGSALAALYPFRPSFYSRMGFGPGTAVHRFRLRPDSLPRRDAADDIVLRRLGPQDVAALRATYERKQRTTHGLFARDTTIGYEMAFEDDARIVGAFAGEELTGYVTYEYRANEERGTTDMAVFEWIYENTAALRGLLDFLRTQRDQVDRIELLTQDDSLHHLLTDPMDETGETFQLNRQMNVRGWGVMHRVLDVARLFEQLAEHDFNGVTLTLGLDVVDDFVAANHGRTRIQFESGRARVLDAGGPTDAELAIDVGDFTALVLGVVPFRRLVEYGRVRVEDANTASSLDRVFAAREAPVCLSRF